MSLVTRNGKGSKLTIEEMDNNLTYLEGLGRPYNVYTALLTQTGTDAPVATVLENTIGNVWFTYEGAGTYFVYSNGLFAINKTWGIADAVLDGPNGVYTPVFVNVSNQTGAALPNSLEIRVQGGDFNGNDLLNNTPIEIRVYN